MKKQKLKKGTLVEVEVIQTGEVFEGTIKSEVDSANKIIVETPEGDKVVYLLDTIVVILPLLDQIWRWVSKWFRRKKKK